MSKRIQGLEDIDVREKAVFLRADLNVPLDGQKVADPSRIVALLPTLRYLMEQKAKVVLASHLGRPKGKALEKYSLMPVAEYLAELINHEVTFPDDCIGDGVKKVLQQQKPGEVVLLENLRFHPEEEANDAKFAEALANNTTVFVNDAFGSLHRAHASTDALPRRYPIRAAGYLVQKELKFLTPLRDAPECPYAVILGGAKISDKVKIIETLIKKVDRLFLGGAMVFTFLKALGNRVGNSLVEDGMLDRAKRMMDDARSRGVQVFLPKDFALGVSIESPGEFKVSEGYDIPEGMMGLDVGPKTLSYFREGLQDAKTIFWNGPMGLFEKPPYHQGTFGLAKIVSELSSIRVIGGGDSAAAMAQAGLSDRVSHISTGGGATLEFLEGKPLPGLEALAV